jgi:hypothetical protein
VTEQHAAEPFDVLAHGERPIFDQGRALGSEPLQAPVAILRPTGDDLAIGVPADEPHAVAEASEQVQTFGGIWPCDQVAADQDDVGASGLDVGEHSFERGEVSVDVVESGDPH